MKRLFKYQYRIIEREEKGILDLYITHWYAQYSLMVIIFGMNIRISRWVTLRNYFTLIGTWADFFTNRLDAECAIEQQKKVVIADSLPKIKKEIYHEVE